MYNILATNKHNRDAKNNKNRSLCQDTLILNNWDILKQLYNLSKPFHKYTIYIKSYTVHILYIVLWEILATIELLVLEYRNFIDCYTTFKLSYEDKTDFVIKYSHILSYIKNTLSKLMKYKELFFQSLVYTIFIARNSTFC